VAAKPIERYPILNDPRMPRDEALRWAAALRRDGKTRTVYAMLAWRLKKLGIADLPPEIH